MITIFTTGGTFDKIYFDANSEFRIGDTQVGPLLQEAGVSQEYDIQPLLRKDSLELTDEDRQLLCERVATCDSQKIIIVHGTDTMVATAKALAAAREKMPQGTTANKKTIVLLGAMQPARMRYSDAAFNLGFSFAAVQLQPPGIYIAMNGCIFPFDKVKKNLAAGRFEFCD